MVLIKANVQTCIIDSVDNELLQGHEIFASGPFKFLTSFIGFALQLSEPLCSFVAESVDGVLRIFLRQYNTYSSSKSHEIERKK